jgi:hypothetical protein
VNTLSLASHPFGRAFDRAQELVVERVYATLPWRLLKLFRTQNERELAECCQVTYVICYTTHITRMLSSSHMTRYDMV